MTLVDELKEKIPEDIQFTPEFKVFLKWVKKEGIQDASQLKLFIEEEIKSHQTWIDQNKKASIEGTMNRQLRDHTRKLDFWKTIQAHILKYLK